MLRTSQTHPLSVDQVTTPYGGKIGLCFCPGRKQPDPVLGSWDRSLEADLVAIRDWGASALVTLLEQDELRRLGVKVLSERADELGLEWHHAPIRDMGVPNSQFESRWSYVGQRVRSLLTQGKHVVLHCRAGRGRTGMVAARLLVELGLSPEDAITAIRTARPGTIESDAQADHVRGCRPVSDHSVRMDQVLGCLLGGAVGDAFGYAVEFSTLAAIRARFGGAGIQHPVFDQGRLVVSDDTQMTLFTAEGLLRALRAAPDDDDRLIEEIRLAYLDWFSTQHGGGAETAVHGESGLLQHPPMWEIRAPGNTCLHALEMGGRGTVKEPINNSKGCGGVMRVAPCGLVPGWSAEKAFWIAADAAALTHGHPSGFVSAGALAAMINRLIAGDGLEGAIARATTLAEGWADGMETVAAVRTAMIEAASVTEESREMADHADRISRIGLGWVAEEALAIGIYAALVGRSFAEVIAIAANHDGDSDSTASIAGQIYGAWKGLGDLPNDWVRRLDVLDAVLAQAAELGAV